MRFPVTIYQDEEGWYVVECPLIPGCMSQGKTDEEALQNIQEAIQLCLEVRQERGLPLTIQSLEVEVPAYTYSAIRNLQSAIRLGECSYVQEIQY